MHEMNICVRSLQQVQEFVSLAMVQPFEILVGNEKQQVNGKSFMEMFCLNFTHPLFAIAECGEEQLLQLHRGQ